MDAEPIVTGVAALLGAVIGAAATLFGSWWIERRGERREAGVSLRLLLIELKETQEAVARTRASVPMTWEPRFPVNQDKWARHERVLAYVLSEREWATIGAARYLVFEARDVHAALMKQARERAEKDGVDVPRPDVRAQDGKLLAALEAALKEAIPELERRVREFPQGRR